VMSRGEIYGEFRREDFRDESILRAAFREQDLPMMEVHKHEDVVEESTES
jgi:hypothetical protein